MPAESPNSRVLFAYQLTCFLPVFRDKKEPSDAVIALITVNREVLLFYRYGLWGLFIPRKKQQTIILRLAP
jgi:hypothetical protein